ncbi:hypothetical protein F2Q69_00015486 [Brassica cretica]|uniref:Uncharacterized protein n=1 Tax=Brassica cretica TaxID=69181 RepID=A0A8S9R036_BRACR|nr:hypothetical protein F2Q69_00015486 [Brassica cretica]
MTFGLVELAVGVILVLVPGLGVSGGLSLFGIDSVVVLALDVVSLVVDILVVSRAFLFLWASSAGFGFSAGRAMDSGIASLSGAVAWASDSKSLFVEPSGVL